MTSYKLNEEKMFADINDDIAIVINGETGIYYGINGFGTMIFANLIKGIPSEIILDELKKIPNIPADIEIKFNDFINIIVEKELLILSDEINTKKPEINSALTFEDGFVLSVSEYNDAQELLLTDPIHEVKEETGWSPDKSALNTDAQDVARRESKMDK